jgi:hypothetical protein
MDPVVRNGIWYFRSSLCPLEEMQHKNAVNPDSVTFGFSQYPRFFERFIDPEKQQE